MKLLSVKKVSAADQEFLYEVYVDSRREEVTLFEWDKLQQDTFLSMQFRAQQAHYEKQYPGAVHEIIYWDEKPIGRIITEIRKSEVLLVDISLVTSWQNKGIGTHLISNLQQQAKQIRKPILLHVYQSNPAERLYKKLGFQVLEEKPPYIAMSWDIVNNSLKRRGN